MISRRGTRQVMIGGIAIGGDATVSIQSMTNVSITDVDTTISQIRDLEAAGCEIVRVGIPNKNAIDGLARIRSAVRIPLVADIHFDHNLALEAIEAGVDKVRINPGNMRNPSHVKEVIDKARAKGIPIRVGANSGSIIPRNQDEGPLRHASAEYMVEAVLEYIDIFRDKRFSDVIVSLKSSSVQETMEAYRLFSQKSDLPLHLGITAAGTEFIGTIKSAIGIGGLLSEGVGDTVRVSLTADPVEEVRVAREILQALGLRQFHPEVISCPTCSRCRIDLIPLVRELEARLSGSHKPVKVALMGCEVNGPGEAADADVGIAAGLDSGMLFRKGKPEKRVKRENFVDTLVKEVTNWQ